MSYAIASAVIPVPIYGVRYLFRRRLPLMAN
jgi:hypothetical protein